MTTRLAYAWWPVQEGPLTRVDWKQLLKDSRAVDPYLVWADFTQLSGYAGGTQADSKQKWPILLQFECGADRAVPVSSGQVTCDPKKECHPVLGMLDIPGVYKQLTANDGSFRRRSDFVTALVSPSCIRELFCFHQVVKRFQLGLPRIPQVATMPSVETLIDIKQQPPGSTPRVVVGVIDDGFAVAHTMFRQPKVSEPRVEFLWDQYSPLDPVRKANWVVFGPTDDEFGYGAEVKRQSIKTLLTQADALAGPTPLHELSAYKELDYAPRNPDPDELSLRLTAATPYATDAPLNTIRSSSHGTSVAALAAGSRMTLPSYHAAQGQWPVLESDKDFSENWPLVLVQLPTRTSLDSSGGSLGVHILDGLRYIIRRARQLPYIRGNGVVMGGPSTQALAPADTKSEASVAVQAVGHEVPFYPDNKIVINISYGAVAGPHDGTSMLEEAIADLVKYEPNLWVVVAAGNAHGSKTHSRLELAECGPAKTLTWTVGPDNLLESYLEIWFPDCTHTGAPLPSAWLDTVTVAIQPPAGLPALINLRQGEAQLLAEGEKALPFAAAIFAKQVAQGRRGTMLLLTCARTRRPMQDVLDNGPLPKPVAPHGRWEITLRWGVGHQLTGRRMVVHAWAERNDQLWGHGRRQQSSVSGEDPVPDRTDFSPSVKEFAERGRLRAHSDEVPRPFQAELSGGSLSHIPRSTQLCDPKLPDGVKGAAVVVGGRRLADGEMARYSGSGVTRSSSIDRGRIPGGDGANVAESAPTVVDEEHQGTVRIHGPHFDAPSDIGTALRGLRTIGFREGSVARIGGTSAAAPLVTRTIADGLYRKLNPEVKNELPRELGPLRDEDNPVHATDRKQRATGTPMRDDRAHRGRVSLSPRIRNRPAK